MQKVRYARPRNYTVFYTVTDDPVAYREHVVAFSADDADRQFRAGLSDDELLEVTVTRITPDANTTELN